MIVVTLNPIIMGALVNFLITMLMAYFTKWALKKYPKDCEPSISGTKLKPYSPDRPYFYQHVVENKRAYFRMWLIMTAVTLVLNYEQFI